MSKDMKCPSSKELGKLWLKFHWENYSHSNFVPFDIEEEGVIVLQVTGDVGDIYYLGIMDENRNSASYSQQRIVGDGYLAIRVPLWPCSFFVTSKSSGVVTRTGLGRPKMQENNLGLKWDGKEYDLEDPRISHLDLYEAPSQLE